MPNNYTDISTSNPSGIGIQPVVKKSTDTGGVHVPHITLDTLLSGEREAIAGQGSFMAVVKNYPYKLVPASSAAFALGAGAIGDLLDKVIVKANSGTITILDDATVILVLPISPVGTVFNLGLVSQNGAWRVTTPATTEAACTGLFTA